MKLTREELRDELWDAMMNRQDIDVSLTDMADACLDRMDEIGVEAVVSGLLTPAIAAGTQRAETAKHGSVPKGCQSGGEAASPNTSRAQESDR